MSFNRPEGFAPNVAIILSTFNGEKYIRDQIGSLLNQSYKSVRIYIRDDGSTDATLGILEGLSDDRIELRNDTLGNLGPSAAFLHLLTVVRADIYFFCDQDDIWRPHKVQEAVTRLADIGFSNPALFHTDLTLVDHKLESLGDTFNGRADIRIPDDYDLGHMLIQNCVVGCTVAVTDALVEVSGVRDLTFEADNVAMHDWWLALCAIVFGEPAYSDRTSVLYRQHSDNVSGASKKRNVVQRLRVVGLGAGIKRIAIYKKRIAKQARYFLDRYGEGLGADQVETLRGISGLGVGSGRRGITFCLKNRIWFKKWYMNASFLLIATLSNPFRKS